MAQGIVRRIDGIGKRDVNAALDSLLSLTSDAMLVFDGSGRILVANDAANRLFTRSGSLAGLDVRALFSSRVVTLPDSPFAFSVLPLMGGVSYHNRMDVASLSAFMLLMSEMCASEAGDDELESRYRLDSFAYRSAMALADLASVGKDFILSPGRYSDAEVDQTLLNLLAFVIGQLHQLDKPRPHPFDIDA